MQVLQEFYVNVTRKIAKPLSKAQARVIVDSYAAWCVETAAAEIYAAFRIEDEARIGFLGRANCLISSQERRGPDSFRGPE
jgi:hypothetical protein